MNEDNLDTSKMDKKIWEFLRTHRYHADYQLEIDNKSYDIYTILVLKQLGYLKEDTINQAYNKLVEKIVELPDTPLSQEETNYLKSDDLNSGSYNSWNLHRMQVLNKSNSHINALEKRLSNWPFTLAQAQVYLLYKEGYSSRYFKHNRFPYDGLVFKAVLLPIVLSMKSVGEVSERVSLSLSLSSLAALQKLSPKGYPLPKSWIKVHRLYKQGYTKGYFKDNSFPYVDLVFKTIMLPVTLGSHYLSKPFSRKETSSVTSLKSRPSTSSTFISSESPDGALPPDAANTKIVKPNIPHKPEKSKR